ncbi:hypothetical protein BKA69DRAFT_1104572 [Paraphysoderma sedebokerense]|nr:hypothetical protein BKA69DRAFT_1104572 [Paraphysoderma sedebokerense]
MVLISTFFTRCVFGVCKFAKSTISSYLFEHYIHRYTGLQIILTLSLLFVSFQVLLLYQPYSHKRLNHLEALSHICSMVVLALGLPFHLDQFRSSVYQQILMVMIIAVICSFIIVTILACVYDAFYYFRQRSSSKS